MQLTNGEVCLWVDEGTGYTKDRRFSDSWYLLRRIKTEKQLSFDELYALTVQYV